MKFSIMLFICITTLGGFIDLNAQSRTQNIQSIGAVKVLGIWVGGSIEQDHGNKFVLRLNEGEAARLKTSPLVVVNQSSIDMVRILVSHVAGTPINESDNIIYEETNSSILESNIKNRNKRKRLTVTGIGLLVSGLLSVVIAQVDLDFDQYKTVQTVLGATLGLSGIAALAVGELETEEYPQLELALLFYKQSIE